MSLIESKLIFPTLYFKDPYSNLLDSSDPLNGLNKLSCPMSSSSTITTSVKIYSFIKESSMVWYDL